MNVAEMIAYAIGATQFVKKLAEKVKIVISGAAAVVLATVVAVGVVIGFHIAQNIPITLAIIGEIVQVAIGANAGYSLIKVAGGSQERGGSGGN